MTELQLPRTGDQALVRQINLSVIMRQLRRKAPMSRADLAESTGLNKSTVSSLIRELIGRKIVHEIGRTSSGTGRPAIQLTLNPLAGFIVSCEIGVGFVLVVCTDFAPEVIWRDEESFDPDAGQNEILQHALRTLRRAIEQCQMTYGTLLGVAVGLPGLIDNSTGTLLYAPNLHWSDVPIRTVFEDALGVPVYVDNEANMAALGEQFFGAARGYNEVLYLSAGVGLGGGIIHGGRIFHGVTGVGAEFGHMTINPEGEYCTCGNRGCWETEVSERALCRFVQTAIARGRNSLLSDVAKRGNMSIEQVVTAADDGDALATDALAQLGHYLGVGIASLVNALNPEMVVFGGTVSQAGDYLMPHIQDELQQRALRWNKEATQVVLAHHGRDACVIGGAATIYQVILS